MDGWMDGDPYKSQEVFADGEASTSVAAPGDSCVVLCDVPAASLSMDAWIPDLKKYCSGKRMVILDPGLRNGTARNLYDAQKYRRPEDVPVKEENFLLLFRTHFRNSNSPKANCLNDRRLNCG